MGQRGVTLAVALALGGCPKPPGSTAPTDEAAESDAPAPATDPVARQVVADFQHAVLTSRDAYVTLFDFGAIGKMEILLHRYDLLGRNVDLDEREKAQYAAEDGTPYPPERERRNVGNFYTILAQRTVGTGGCAAHEPRTHYGQLLGEPYAPLPAGTPPGYESLRAQANAWLQRGGVVGMTCGGGKGGLALVYTAKDNARGYDVITIYDD